MTEFESMNQRLAEMEAQLAHQDVALQHLSDNAAKQWAAIDKLEQAVKRLTERFVALENSGPEVSSLDEPPPHY
jgi:uncharacterized coiled-coil protein SlyX